MFFVLTDKLLDFWTIVVYSISRDIKSIIIKTNKLFLISFNFKIITNSIYQLYFQEWFTTNKIKYYSFTLRKLVQDIINCLLAYFPCHFLIGIFTNKIAIFTSQLTIFSHYKNYIFNAFASSSITILHSFFFINHFKCKRSQRYVVNLLHHKVLKLLLYTNV